MVAVKAKEAKSAVFMMQINRYGVDYAVTVRSGAVEKRVFIQAIRRAVSN